MTARKTWNPGSSAVTLNGIAVAPGSRSSWRVATVAPSASRRRVAPVVIVERSRTTRSIVSPTRAPGGASSASTSTSAADSSAGVTASSRMPRAAAAAIASSASPDVSLPSESSTIRCCVPAGKIAAASRTAAPTSVAPATGAEAGSDSSSSSDGRRSTSALAPKTTTPAVSPSGISPIAARAQSTRSSRVASSIEADASSRKTTLSRSDGSARRIPASDRTRHAASTMRMASDAIRRPRGSVRDAASQPTTTIAPTGTRQPQPDRVGEVQRQGHRARPPSGCGRRPNARARVRRVGRW